MKITPLDIRQKSFEKVFRGYDKDEVTAFLNSLSHEWEKVQDDYKEMKIRLETAQKEMDRLRQVESSLYKTLKTAEDTGASLVDQASKTAELKLREAQVEAEDRLNKAQEKARKIVAGAERNSKMIIEEMKNALKNVESDFYRLQGMKEDLLRELKNLSNDTLEKLDKYADDKKKPSFEERLQKVKSSLVMKWTEDEDASDDQPVSSDLQATGISDNEPTESFPIPEDPEQDEKKEASGKKDKRSFFDEI